MDLFKLQRPVKKKPNSEATLSGRKPFPIHIKSVYDNFCPEDFISIHSGRFTGFSVVVDDKEEMKNLYANGFFGKGCLSKRFPNFGEPSDGVPPMIRRRQWLQRQKWSSEVREMANASHLSHSGQNGFDDSMSSNSHMMNNEGPPTKQIKLNSGDGIEPSNGEEAPVRNQDMDSSAATGSEQNNEEEWGQVTVSAANVSSANQVIVLPDSDDELDQITLESSSPSCFVVESLHLFPEEAFFLAWALGTLQVIDLLGNVMSLKSLWRTFCLKKDDFVATYAAYHYYRANGWVVKSGINFGANFVLYEKGPAFNHSSFIVRVSSPNNNNAYNVRAVATLTRLAESAKKGVVICDVTWPDGLDLSLPDALRKASVNSTLIQRWRPSEMRNEDD